MGVISRWSKNVFIKLSKDVNQHLTACLAIELFLVPASAPRLV